MTPTFQIYSDQINDLLPPENAVLDQSPWLETLLVPGDNRKARRLIHQLSDKHLPDLITGSPITAITKCNRIKPDIEMSISELAPIFF